MEGHMVSVWAAKHPNPNAHVILPMTNCYTHTHTHTDARTRTRTRAPHTRKVLKERWEESERLSKAAQDVF